VAEIVEAVVARVVGQPLERVEQRRGREDEDLVGDEVAGRLVGLVGVIAHRSLPRLLNCWDTHTSESPALWQLLSGKSMRRCVPA
jgi:hypothetical protein